jgi:carboxyl-terminal processing protease
VPKRNLAWILVVAVIVMLMWLLPQTIAVRDSIYEAFGPLVEVRAEIRKRSVEDVDDAVLVDAAVDAGIKAMVDKLHDPRAVYLNRRQYDQFRKRTDGIIGGIGAEVWATDVGLEVLSREPNSPAANADVLPGEIITHIDGRPMAGVPLFEAVNMLNGPPGSEVTMTVMARNGPRGGVEGGPSTREVRLRREEIEVDPIRGWSRSPTGDWRFMLDPEARIGYIRLARFTVGVDEGMDARVNRLLRHELRGLVLDLRENPGGLFDSGIAVADRFLERGLLVRKRGRKTAPAEWYAMREGTYPRFEMAVLVNGSTASAAELVAGALRDHGRAAIVGERSYGKGSVQEVVELDRGGALKLTTAYYYLPNGECIHRSSRAIEAGQWGVDPTLPVSLTDRQRERWRAAWREFAREVVSEDAATQPAAPPGGSSEALEREAAARGLLDADLQLHKAVEYLRSRIDRDHRGRKEAAHEIEPASSRS